MLFKIAWRNLLRNKRRSLIILVSICVGVAALLFNDALSVGIMDQLLDNQIMSNTAHIQIHEKGYNGNKVIQKLVPEPEKVENVLRYDKNVKYFSKRLFSYGLLSSANSSAGIALEGVEPQKEPKISTIKKSIIQGHYLTGKSHEIVIGEKLAEKLEVGLGDKVVAIATDINGIVSNELFRVVGIYKTSSWDFDRTFIYVSLTDAREMLGVGNNVSEFAIIIKEPDKVMGIKSGIAKRLGSRYEVLAYPELLPMIMTMIEIYKEYSYVMYLIIGIAILFGIINTMLMSVFERINEIGVLMAIGMRNLRIFIMVLLEAFILGGVGTLAGFIIGLALVITLSHTGIDLSFASSALSSMGFSNIIYPKLNVMVILNAIFIMPFVAMLGAVYPARKALKLQPTDAMRHV